MSARFVCDYCGCEAEAFFTRERGAFLAPIKWLARVSKAGIPQHACSPECAHNIKRDELAREAEEKRARKKPVDEFFVKP